MVNENSLGEKITDSEESLAQFYSWFGDSACVDDKGRPLVVYHGSSEDFDEFVLPHNRDDEYYDEGYDGGNLGHGFYFTSSERYAGKFGKTKRFYLRISNLLDCTDRSVIVEINNRREEFGDEYMFGEYGEIIDEIANERGCDGKYGDTVGGFSTYGEDEWVVIRSNQAKLVANVKYSDSDKIHEEIVRMAQLAGIDK